MRISTENSNGEKINVNYDKKPDKCPVCHQGIDAKVIFGYSEREYHHSAQVVFQCPRHNCQSLFIGYYRVVYGGRSSDYLLSYTEPTIPEAQKFSETIETLSKSFVSIYNEAHHAEQYGLMQVCGVGYRKSLEFLIKDYAIHLNPDEEESIKKAKLAQVIDNYIEDERIKQTAKRAAWLGNDETHYYRKWKDMDIKDLKTLIELTIRWIEMEEMTKDYGNKMK